MVKCDTEEIETMLPCCILKISTKLINRSRSAVLYPEDGNAVTCRVVPHLEGWQEAMIAEDEHPAPRRQDTWLVLSLRRGTVSLHPHLRIAGLKLRQMARFLLKFSLLYELMNR
jgi:hypothetical protein